LASELGRKSEARVAGRRRLRPLRELSLKQRHGLHKDAVRRRALAGADAGALIVTIVLSALFGTFRRPEYFLLVALGLAPTWPLLIKAMGLYDRAQRRLRHSTLDEMSNLLFVAVMETGLFVVTYPVLGLGEFRTTLIPRFALLAFVALVLARVLCRFVLSRVVSADRTVLIGGERDVRRLARRLRFSRDHHVDLIGFLGSDMGDHASSALNLPRLGELGEIGELERVAADHRVERVVFAAEEHVHEARELLVECRRLGLKLTVLPRDHEVMQSSTELNRLADLPLLELHVWDPPRSSMLIKRTFDVAASGLALIAFAPAFPLIAALVRLDSKGPVFFRQRRAGQDGKPFAMVKFRSMCANAEELLPELVNFDKLGEPSFKIHDDPRVTRVGRVLRALSLDELPQLVNVLRGDMSMVGPRPEEEEVVLLYTPEQRFRLDFKPGLTGPMQVHGRGDLTFDERLALEREYIENYSLVRDLEILFRTVPAVLSRAGAY